MKVDSNVIYVKVKHFASDILRLLDLNTFDTLHEIPIRSGATLANPFHALFTVCFHMCGVDLWDHARAWTLNANHTDSSMVRTNSLGLVLFNASRSTVYYYPWWYQTIAPEKERKQIFIKRISVYAEEPCTLE